jgi:Na+/proline symporter
MSWVLIIFLLYLIGMVVVEIITARRVSSSIDDFLLGGKKMPALVIALSEKSTDMSA